MLLEARLFDGNGALAAAATSTWRVLKPDPKVAENVRSEAPHDDAGKPDLCGSRARLRRKWTTPAMPDDYQLAVSVLQCILMEETSFAAKSGAWCTAAM